MCENKPPSTSPGHAQRRGEGAQGNSFSPHKNTQTNFRILSEIAKYMYVYMVRYGRDLWGRGSNHTRNLSERVSRTFNVCQISIRRPSTHCLNGMSRKTSTSCRSGCPNAKTMTRVQLVVNPSNL